MDQFEEITKLKTLIRVQHNEMTILYDKVKELKAAKHAIYLENSKLRSLSQEDKINITRESMYDNLKNQISNQRKEIAKLNKYKIAYYNLTNKIP